MKRFKKIKKLSSFFILAVFFIVGVLFSLNTWDGKIFVTLNSFQGRQIASFDSSSEFLPLSTQSLKTQIQKTLFQNTKVNYQEEGVEFYLGSFLTPSRQRGGYQFACQAYSFVEMHFISTGVFLSGHKGKMVVQAPCFSEEEGFIGPFWIPIQEIVQNSNRSFFSDENTQTFISFYDASIRLMKNWQLMRVRFFNSEEDDGFLALWRPGDSDPEEEEVRSFQISLD